MNLERQTKGINQKRGNIQTDQAKEAVEDMKWVLIGLSILAVLPTVVNTLGVG